MAPGSVLVTAGDTGDRVTVPVDDRLLALGAERIVAVVAERVAAVERGFDPGDATPSPACSRCRGSAYGYRASVLRGSSWA